MDASKEKELELRCTAKTEVANVDFGNGLYLSEFMVVFDVFDPVTLTHSPMAITMVDRKMYNYFVDGAVYLLYESALLQGRKA